jgi:predicted DNA-binding transcriptional regulator AlpA
MPQRKLPDSPTALIDKAELAKALGVSTYTIDDWLRKGKLIRPIPLAGNVHRWRMRDIEKWLRQMETRSHVPQTLRGMVKVQHLARLQAEDDPEVAEILEQVRKDKRKLARDQG